MVEVLARGGVSFESELSADVSLVEGDPEPDPPDRTIGSKLDDLVTVFQSDSKDHFDGDLLTLVGQTKLLKTFILKLLVRMPT